MSRAPTTRTPLPPPTAASSNPAPQLSKILPWPEKSKLIDGQAVALQCGEARAAGSTSKGRSALKRNTVSGLVLGLFKAQPAKQACAPYAQAAAQLWRPAPEGPAKQSALRVVHFSLLQ